MLRKDLPRAAAAQNSFEFFQFLMGAPDQPCVCLKPVAIHREDTIVQGIEFEHGLRMQVPDVIVLQDAAALVVTGYQLIHPRDDIPITAGRQTFLRRTISRACQDTEALHIFRGLMRVLSRRDDDCQKMRPLRSRRRGIQENKGGLWSSCGRVCRPPQMRARPHFVKGH